MVEFESAGSSSSLPGRVGRVQTKVEFAQIYGIYGKLFIPVFPQSDDSDTEEYSDLRPK